MVVLISSVSDSETAKLSNVLQVFFWPLKKAVSTPSLVLLGVFASALLVSCGVEPAVAANCKPTAKLEAAKLKYVQDGDTLLLQSGERVRLIGVNTPEIGRKGKADQPLAQEARQALKRFLGAGSTIYLQSGEQAKDRYGRRLAYVFRTNNGELASEHLIAKGLGWQVVVPPNMGYTACLAEAEAQARDKGQSESVWQPRLYPLRDAKKLKKGHAGFVRVTGRVQSVEQSRNAYWITLDDTLAIKLRKSDLLNFDGLDPKSLQGKQLNVRGWMSYRGKSRAGFAPFVLPLSHPVMLETEL